MNFLKKFNLLSSLCYFLAGLLFVLSAIVLQNYFSSQKEPEQVIEKFN